MSRTFKKMAGTAAVFVLADQHANSPVERDGLVWSESDLHMDALTKLNKQAKSTMATSLALEGLESYDPPSHGDVRMVAALKSEFIYNQTIKGWVELAQTA